MVISYLGKQFFKITQGDLTIAINPPSKESEHGSARFGADIVLITTRHKDFNGADTLTAGDKAPFVIAGPGEYEVKDVHIEGAGVPVVLGGVSFISTVYRITIEGMSIVFAGPLATSTLPMDVRQIANSPDILFVPVGGGDILDSKEAAKLVVSLEAKISIPMDYDNDVKSPSLGSFLKDTGQENAERADKLTLKRKDIDLRQGTVVVLTV